MRSFGFYRPKYKNDGVQEREMGSHVKGVGRKWTECRLLVRISWEKETTIKTYDGRIILNAF
jgi:hypothetical protein